MPSRTSNEEKLCFLDKNMVPHTFICFPDFEVLDFQQNLDLSCQTSWLLLQI